MERNVRLYPWYQAFWNLLFWIPVFFLYFASRLTPAEVLALEGTYYLAVVLLEVPSGYFSDRIGRRVTLLIATAAWTAANVTFALADGFVSFVAAQVLLAVGMAFNSGTDTSLLYDSLAELDRAGEVLEQESRAQTWGFLAAGASAVIGGLVAGIDLRLAYVASAAAAVVALSIAWRFSEPVSDRAAVQTPLRQLLGCVGLLRDRTLAWLFAFAVAMTVFNHVPYEFFQPWLDLLMAGGERRYDLTPAVSGLLTAIVAVVAARAAAGAAPLEKRLGMAGTLLLTMALQGAVMLAMARWLHPAVLLLVMLRSVPRGLSGPVVNAAVHPRVPTASRGTFLSLQSLAGRLGFSLCLYGAAAWLGGLARLTLPRLSEVLLAFAAALGAAWLLLALSRPRTRPAQ